MIESASKPYWDARKKRWTITVKYNQDGTSYSENVRFHREEQADNYYSHISGRVGKAVKA